jgi:Putative zinc-finger
MNTKSSAKDGARYERLGRILAMAAGMEPSGGQCPTLEQLAAMMDQGLDGKERDTLLGHLAGCDRCREVLITAVRLSAADEAQEVRQGWRFGFLVPYAAAAAVLIAVVSAALVYRGNVKPSVVQVAKQYAPAVEKKIEAPAAQNIAEPAPVEAKKQVEKPKPAPAPSRPGGSLRLSDMPEGGTGGVKGYALKEKAAPPVESGNIEYEQPARRAAPPPSTSGPSQGMMGFSDSSAGTAEESDSLKPSPPPQYAPRAMTAPEASPALTELPASPPEAAKPEAQSEVVKATGVIVSLDLENGELVFLPKGEKDKVHVKVDPSLLEGLQAGDKVMMVYDKSKANVATRIKKQRVIIVPVGC